MPMGIIEVTNISTNSLVCNGNIDAMAHNSMVETESQNLITEIEPINQTLLPASIEHSNVNVVNLPAPIDCAHLEGEDSCDEHVQVSCHVEVEQCQKNLQVDNNENLDSKNDNVSVECVQGVS